MTTKTTISTTEKTPKNSKHFSCEICYFYAKNKQDYTRHLHTKKHMNNASTTELLQITPNYSAHICVNCDKKFNDRAGLWRHNKKCLIIDNHDVPKKENSHTITTDIVMEIMKQNKDVQNLLIEQNNKLMDKISEMSVIQNNTIMNTNSNNNSNNSFNLNFFLNEQCKNAVNLVDFINSLQVGVKDLERTGKLGYVEGISQIFLEGLKELDVYNRPIHCTDLKRETVYVRDQDKWEKENEEKTKLNQAVKSISIKNLKQLPKWEDENPEYSDFDSKKNDEYMKISKSSLGGYDSEEDNKYKEMIIKNVLKHTKVPAKEDIKVDTIQ